MALKIQPKMLLPDEWPFLFIQYLLKQKFVFGKYREINVTQLVKKANGFALAMKMKFGANITGNDVMDVCFNEGFLVPCGTDTFIIKEDMRRLR